MTAAEARKQAQENIESATQSEFNEVMEHVRVAVKSGNMNTTFYNKLSDLTIKRLEEEPNYFKIYYKSDWRDGGYYEIHW